MSPMSGAKCPHPCGSHPNRAAHLGPRVKPNQTKPRHSPARSTRLHARAARLAKHSGAHDPRSLLCANGRRSVRSCRSSFARRRHRPTPHDTTCRRRRRRLSLSLLPVSLLRLPLLGRALLSRTIISRTLMTLDNTPALWTLAVTDARARASVIRRYGRC